MTMTRRKKALFAAAAMLLGIAGTGVALLAADLAVHYRAERSAGVNRWGYRGPVAGRKAAGEWRVVILGGSTAFGYGVSWNESIPYLLEERIRRQTPRPVTVVNLGFNNEGAHAFLPNLEDYAFIDYDLVILYEGYNDLPGDRGPNTRVYRRESPVFRLTGYFPILPLYLDEKAKALRHGGDLGAAYATQRGEVPKTVFRPNVLQRTSAGALDAAARVTNALGNQLDGLSAVRPQSISPPSAIGCRDPYVHYCNAVHAAVRFARARDARVIVAGQPRLPGRGTMDHEHQQSMLKHMIADQFGADRGVLYLNLAGTIDLTDVAMSFDGMHLNAAGNARVADALAPAVLALATHR
jgi:lysophospholipase L1-like esterase